MLPVVAGPDETRKQIVIYSALLVPLAIWPAFIGLGGALYALASIVLGGVFLALASTSITRARAAKATAPPSSCSASRSSTCSCCLPCSRSSRASAYWLALSPWRSQHVAGSRSARMGTTTQDAARSRIGAGAGGPGGAVLRGDDRAAGRQRAEPAAVDIELGGGSPMDAMTTSRDQIAQLARRHRKRRRVVRGRGRRHGRRGLRGGAALPAVLPGSPASTARRSAPPRPSDDRARPHHDHSLRRQRRARASPGASSPCSARWT